VTQKSVPWRQRKIWRTDMLTHEDFGNLLLVGEPWYGWKNVRWAQFETYDGLRVNLPLSEVSILA